MNTCIAVYVLLTYIGAETGGWASGTGGTGGWASGTGGWASGTA